MAVLAVETAELASVFADAASVAAVCAVDLAVEALEFAVAMRESASDWYAAKVSLLVYVSDTLRLMLSALALMAASRAVASFSTLPSV